MNVSINNTAFEILRNTFQINRMFLCSYVHVLQNKVNFQRHVAYPHISLHENDLIVGTSFWGRLSFNLNKLIGQIRSLLGSIMELENVLCYCFTSSGVAVNVNYVHGKVCVVYSFPLELFMLSTKAVIVAFWCLFELLSTFNKVVVVCFSSLMERLAIIARNIVVRQ